jgi:hypothetical protein
MLWRKRVAQDNDVIFRRKKTRKKLTGVLTKPQTIGQDGNIESSALYDLNKKITNIKKTS